MDLFFSPDHQIDGGMYSYVQADVIKKATVFTGLSLSRNALAASLNAQSLYALIKTGSIHQQILSNTVQEPYTMNCILPLITTH